MAILLLCSMRVYKTGLFGSDLALTKVKQKQLDNFLINLVENAKLLLNSKKVARVEHFGVQ